jgi:uncharacterized membrane protein
MPESSTSSASGPSSGAGPLDPRSAKARRRIDSIDLLRGVVMVIMMLDHTRDYLHSGSLLFDPLDLSKTTTAVFLTRWITHYCAPIFVFLAGTGAFLYGARGKNKGELTRFLLTRGLWLIVMEVTVVRILIVFNVDLSMLAFLQVIWVIGFSMICLAGLIHLPLSVTAGFGLLMIALHNLLDTRLNIVQFAGPSQPLPGFKDKILMLLHQQGAFPIDGLPSPIVFVAYPLIPWIGVMALGYAFGAMFKIDAERRRKLFLYIGGACIMLFCVLRAWDLYGDPRHWHKQKNAIFTLLSFVNTTKYPPSLLFLLMTLGPGIIALAWFEAVNRGAVGRFFVTFGRVPFFFYLLQWFTAHTIAIILHAAFGKPVRWLFQTPLDWFSHPPAGNGFRLWVVWLAWITGVLLLYPLCKWFAGVKARRSDWWLSYL